MPGWLAQLWYGRSAWRWALWPVSLLFVLGVRIRRSRYRRRGSVHGGSALPVVVVGNISVGGTGKTPLVIWLVEQLRARQVRVGVVSRGYGGLGFRQPKLIASGDSAAEVGDEPLLISRRTGVPVVVCTDRRAAVMRLAQEDVALAISDDGLQHYAMARAMEIVVVDGERGLGNGLCLPAGPLREPVTRLSEVDAVVVNGSQHGARIPADSLHMQLVPGDLVSLSDAPSLPLAGLQGHIVHAVAGIGHPQRFFTTLEQAGLTVLAHPLDDHARLRYDDLMFADDYPVVMTEKDAVKCGGLRLPRHWYLPVQAELSVADGQALLDAVLARTGCAVEPCRG